MSVPDLDISKKIFFFDYFIDILLSKIKDKNDFSMLKLQKLLFLTSVASVLNDKENNLLDVFSFQAWQYGPVEPQIYDNYNKSGVNKFSIPHFDSSLTSSSNAQIKSCLIPKEQKMIEDSVITLLELNKNILKTNPFILVDITHEYNSWKLNYEPGLKKTIPKDHILGDKRIFSN